MQALLSFGSLVLGAVAHDSVAVRQVEVECDQRAVLQAQGPQCGAVNLSGGVRWILVRAGERSEVQLEHFGG